MDEALPPSEYVRRMALSIDAETDLRDDATLMLVAWTGGPEHVDADDGTARWWIASTLFQGEPTSAMQA